RRNRFQSGKSSATKLDRWRSQNFPEPLSDFRFAANRDVRNPFERNHIRAVVDHDGTIAGAPWLVLAEKSDHLGNSAGHGGIWRGFDTFPARRPAIWSVWLATARRPRKIVLAGRALRISGN